MAPILRLDGVVAGYGAGDVLRGVDLSLEPGTVTCLVGPNGAGKSTVLKTVSGLLRPSRGAITFRGQEINALSPRARLLLGIVHVPQERSLFPAMSVWDNLLLGGYVIADMPTLRARAEEAAQAFPICRTRAREPAGSLSGGEQKQVELARAMMLAPTLMLLDEPSVGLDPRSRQIVFDAIRALSAAGRTILLVEQNARSGLAAAVTGAVMESGTVRLVDSGARLLDNPEVARLFLGAGGKAPPAPARAPNEMG